MQIEIGKYYVNKTWKYLLPCLKEYGITFKSKYDSLFKLAVGVFDNVLEGTDFENEKLLFVLIDKKYRPKITYNIMDYMRNQPFTVCDYAFDDLEEGRKHMFVFRIPEKYYTAYDEFINGRYSRMYSPEEIQYLFPEEGSEARQVFDRTDEAIQNFIGKVKNSFGTTITKKDLVGAEIDFPIEKFKEIFNYKEELVK